MGAQNQEKDHPTPSKLETVIGDLVFSSYPIMWFFLFWPLTITIKLFPQFSNNWFANFYSILMNANKSGYDPFKSKFFESLIDDPIISCDKELRSKNKFRLLDIGVGPGTNLEFYPKNTSLVALDVNAHFKKYFDDNLTEYHKLRNKVPRDSNSNDENANIKISKEENLTLEKFLICSAEDMSAVESSSVDVVVATHLLCTVQNREKVLSEIHRVLTPGGRYYMLEHVSHQGRISFMIQWLIKPFWSVFNGGCNLQSETMKVIKESGLFKGAEEIKYGILRPLPFPVNPNISGILIK